MKNVLKILGNLCLILASVFAFVNIVSQTNVFAAWLVMALYMVSLVSNIFWIIKEMKRK
ncbi:MAG: hypothetical protein IKJ19_06325 [Clostridia bacterium]|nr:hypothetical protein [Clostridia bacterium]